MAETSAKKALVILAPGAEEIETVVPVDVMRRAGIRVTMAGLEGREPVECSRGVRIVPDKALSEIINEDFDAVVLPGGDEGSKRLAASKEVKEILGKHQEMGRIVAAICAGPRALSSANVIRKRSFTCHPAVMKELEGEGSLLSGKVVRDGNLITSQGPGTAFAFALAIVEALLGEEKARMVAGPMLLAIEK